MTKTHKFTPPEDATEAEVLEITAWQNIPGTPTPVWVFRNFHKVGGKPGQLTGGARTGFIACPVNYWIITTDSGFLGVMDDDTFKKHCTPINETTPR